MKQLHIFILLVLTNAVCTGQTTKRTSFFPGDMWPDTNGNHINAHGGGILYHEGMYYWYGECKDANSNKALLGVSCYSSIDLYNWDNLGVVLKVVESDTLHELSRECVLERPKVVYNAATKKFVMWFHLELRNQGYKTARVALATSESPTGPFQYVKSLRPNAGIWPANLPEDQQVKNSQKVLSVKWWTPEWYKAVNDGYFVSRDFSGGQMSRDMTIFVDDDNKAYHIYSSEENLTLQIAELSADYQTHTGKYIRVAPGGHNEAPALFKKDGKYFMITSGCTGWAPNAARLMVADNIMGEWKVYPNPCVGKNSEITFGGQSTFVLPVSGKKDSFIFMADIWTPETPKYGKHMWLPIKFVDNMPVIQWKNKWDLGVF